MWNPFKRTEQRSIKRLLKLLMKHMPEYLNSKRVGGLCGSTDCLLFDGIITYDEKCELHLYILQHRPKNVGVIFWWVPYDVPSRIAFLKQLIKEL